MRNFKMLFEFLENNNFFRYRISNKEQGMMKFDERTCLLYSKVFDKLRNLKFLVRYSIFKKYPSTFNFAFSTFLITLCLCLPLQVSKGCGPLQLVFEGYTFINPKIVNTEATYAPYFLRFNDLYNSYDSLQAVQTDDNLKEWNERFCDAYTIPELRAIIYKATVQDMKLLRNAANDKKTKLPAKFNNNDFAYHLTEEKCIEVIEYLIYAKQCEPHVTTSGDVWAAPKRDAVEIQKMMERGRRAFMKTKSHYVRLRYTYQIIRLAHYGKRYEELLKLYDKLMPKVHANPSLIDYWIMGHKAGALLKLGRRVEASYLYSLIFANCPSKRQTAFQSFSIKNNQEWKDLMLMCKSDDERAMIYTIRANDDTSRAVEEMSHIYNLDPLNENLELLMVKEIFKLEKDLLGIDFNDKKRRNKTYFKTPRKEVGKYHERLRDFAKKCIKERQVDNRDFWRVAEGYLTFLGGDYYESEKTFRHVKETLERPNKELTEQLEVAELALKIAQMDSNLDSEDENEIGNIIRDNPHYWKYKDFPDYMNDKLYHVFEKSGEKGKSFRIRYPFRALQMNPDLEIIEDLLEICRKENKSNLEAALVKKDNLITIENDLIKLKGITFFNNGKIEAAAEIFGKLPRNEYDEKFNPFHENIIDDPNEIILDTTLYDRVGVIGELLDLEYKGRAHLLTDGAVSFYQLGNAYYNMSYFGNSWQVLDLYRSGANWRYSSKGNNYYTSESDLGNLENMNLDKAKLYYETALEIAKDDELKAKVCFMLAKCSLNEFYLDKDTNYDSYDDKVPVLPEQYFKYHKRLIEEFSETEFFEEVIEECSFLYAYK